MFNVMPVISTFCSNNKTLFCKIFKITWREAALIHVLTKKNGKYKMSMFVPTKGFDRVLI